MAQLRALDLFCGAAGGWSLGLHRAGIRTVAACELDPWRRAVFSANNPGVVMYGDVRELDAARLRSDLGYLPDIVVGSPPCQQISAANTKGGGITDDHLFWEWARLVFEVRPVWCAAENSPRARTAGIDGILSALEAAGYAAWPCVVGADHAGANHERRRLWLIAADAERDGLWQQPRRGGGARGAGPAVARGDDPDTHGRLAGRTGRHADGCLAERERPHGDDPDADRQGQHGCAGDGQMARRVDGIAQHAARVGCDCRRPAETAGRPLSEPTGDAEGHHPHARRQHDEGQEEPRRTERVGSARPAADADGARHAFGSRLAGDDGEELQPALRAIGLGWPAWNGGIAGLAAACAFARSSELDDGLSERLVSRRRNSIIAALGDAVAPQITEALARAMMATLGQAERAT